MRIDKVKRCMGLGILLLMAGCSVGAGAKPETDSKKVESLVQIIKEGSELAVRLCSEDDAFYMQCLQNLGQGNSITYADGYYYFRSQTENYSLCRSEGAGMPVEVVADQIPGSIYVKEDQVYFINVSDNRTLYCVGTDGSGLQKLSDFPMQELVVLEDKIYFRSVYEREYDPFYQLTEEPVEDDRYLYSMNLDGSGCKLLVPKLCFEFTTDGEWLYYRTYEGEKCVLYKNSLDGKDEEIIYESKSQFWNLIPYQGDLYWVDDEKLVRLNAQGEKEVLAYNVWRFTISRGQAYSMDEEEIRRIDLMTKKEHLLVKKERQDREDTYSWSAGSYNRGIFLVNGQVFARYFESEDKGVLWHILDGETFTVFEDMEPLVAEELVRDTSLLYEFNFYYPGREDENAESYLDMDGELHYEESFGTREDGSACGDFSLTLPKFNDRLGSYEQMNEQMEALFELAMEDKDSFFQEISELNQEPWMPWYREHEYSHVYIGETYISMYYSRGGYEGGIRDWKSSMPLIFDRETGLMVHMDYLFTVEESIYMKRLTGAIYKYCEMTGMDWWNDAFDNNVLVKNFRDLRCYLTPDGIVLCYERYEIQPGASGSPAFEIPYEWFADIFKQ